MPFSNSSSGFRCFYPIWWIFFWFRVRCSSLLSCQRKLIKMRGDARQRQKRVVFHHHHHHLISNHCTSVCIVNWSFFINLCHRQRNQRAKMAGDARSRSHVKLSEEVIMSGTHTISLLCDKNTKCMLNVLRARHILTPNSNLASICLRLFASAAVVLVYI